MRLFVAIPLEQRVSGEIQKVSDSLRSVAGRIRWTAPESWHITLQFLGNVTPEQLPCLMAHLGKVQSQRISIQLGGIEVFDRAGVLFVGVTVSEKLAALQRNVSSATEACGFAPESRPYHPHITLARVKDHALMRQLRELIAGRSRQPAFGTFEAEEFLLYESLLDRGGSRYEIRAQFPLSC
jgi:RNA 2',3'-cyclic 3'-phosphodiesterase